MSDEIKLPMIVKKSQVQIGPLEYKTVAGTQYALTKEQAERILELAKNIKKRHGLSGKRAVEERLSDSQEIINILTGETDE